MLVAMSCYGFALACIGLIHQSLPALACIRIGMFTAKELSYPDDLQAEHKAIRKLEYESQRASCPAYFEESQVEDAILRATINEDLDQKQQFALVRSTIEEFSFPERAKQITSKEKK